MERLFSRLCQVLTDTRTCLSQDHADEELILLVDAADWEEYPHSDEIVREYRVARKWKPMEKKRKALSDKGKPRKKKKPASKSQNTSPIESTQSTSDSDHNENRRSDPQGSSDSNHSETNEP